MSQDEVKHITKIATFLSGQAIEQYECTDTKGVNSRRKLEGASSNKESKSTGDITSTHAACSLRLAAATIRLRLRLLQYFSLYGLQLQQSKQLQQCRLVASRTRPCM
jgi:hypothetical protein